MVAMDGGRVGGRQLSRRATSPRVAAVHRSQRGAASQQQSGGGEVRLSAVEGVLGEGAVDGCQAILVVRVRVGSQIEQGEHQLFMFLLGGQVQGRVALAVGGADSSGVPRELADPLQVSGARRGAHLLSEAGSGFGLVAHRPLVENGHHLTVAARAGQGPRQG